MKSANKERKIGLDAPEGVPMDVNTPWGTVEQARVVVSPGWNGELVRYAMIGPGATGPHPLYGDNGFNTFKL